jgi:hypothetical protein
LVGISIEETLSHQDNLDASTEEKEYCAETLCSIPFALYTDLKKSCIQKKHTLFVNFILPVTQLNN